VLPFAFTVIGLRFVYFFGKHVYEAIKGAPEDPAPETQEPS